MDRHYLHALIEPRAIAVYGASGRDDAVGGRVFQNLIAGGFAGAVVAVNPKYDQVRGRPCFPTLAAAGQTADLAVIATPAATVPRILDDCGAQGVTAAVILSAGFRAGAAGLLEQTLQAARRHGIRILGPNCLGLIRPAAALNATFSRNNALPGRLALVSQSGALCTAILDWAAAYGVGFSLIASIGDAADVGFGDLLDYLALDGHTGGILLYVEGLSESRSFMSGLRAAARLKPVIVVKAGRHAAGSRAAMSHTGAMVGADDVFDAALRRAGAVRVYAIEQLFAAAELLASGRRVEGGRLAVVTNGGGPGVMAVDRAADLGVAVAALGDATLERLDRALPPGWSRANPVDILGDARPARYGEAVAACLDDAGVDAVLALLTPQAMTQPDEAAAAVAGAAAAARKPVLACWMGGEQVAAGRRRLTAGRIPVFDSPEAAVEAFGYLAAHRAHRRLLMQVPAPLDDGSRPDVQGARLIVEAALAEGRGLLSGTEARALLHAFGIPVARAIAARTAAEALVAAETVGLPVAMKIASPDITHKSDVDGVRLNLGDAAAVRHAFQELTEGVARRFPDKRVDGVTVEPMVRRPHGRELLVGVVTDPVFGPVIGFGTGGTAVEWIRDRAVGLPPLNTLLARDLIARTKAGAALGAFRGRPPADTAAVERVLLRVSELVCEVETVRELDINPLIVDEHGAVAVDVRVAVQARAAARRRYGHMAVHPYPADLVSRWQLPDGTDIKARPIRPEDAHTEQAFVSGLSPQSRYLRFMHSFTELSDEMLVRLTQIDYDREMGLIAVREEGGEEREELGVARYIIDPDGEGCEFAVVVADAWQHRGIGYHLITLLLDAARRRGLRRMHGEILTENTAMLQLVRDLGFDVSPHPREATLQAAARRLD